MAVARSNSDERVAECYAQALKFLARREHSTYELVKKLLSKGFEQDVIDQTIKRLLASLYISDARFAEMLARSRVSQGYGPIRIRHELSHQHQISSDIITAAIDVESPDWQELAQAQLNKRFHGEPPQDFKTRQKQQRYLYQRGFSMEVISALIAQ